MENTNSNKNLTQEEINKVYKLLGIESQEERDQINAGNSLIPYLSLDFLLPMEVEKPKTLRISNNTKFSSTERVKNAKLE